MTFYMKRNRKISIVTATGCTDYTRDYTPRKLYANFKFIKSKFAMSSNTEITLQELAQHNTDKDAWIAVRGKVYNVTDYIAKHPGGKATLMQGVGKDATELFNKAHSYVNPDSVLKGKQVGVLKNEPGTSPRFLRI